MQIFSRRFGTFDFDKFLDDMKIKSSLALFSIVGIVGLALLFQEYNPFGNGNLVNSPQRDAALVKTISQILNRGHFEPKAVDDTFSKNVFSLYLKESDGGKRFFTQADVNQLKPYELLLDDQTQAGTFECFDLSVQLMESALTKTKGWYQEILSEPMDFNKNEQLQADGDKLKWAKDDAELRNRWEQWMKYEVLTRVNDEQEKQEKPEFKGERRVLPP